MQTYTLERVCSLTLLHVYAHSSFFSTSILEGNQSPGERDQMGEEHCADALTVSASVSDSGRETKKPRTQNKEVGSGKRLLPDAGSWHPQGFACSLCKLLFSSLEHLKEHEYHHTLSMMALSLDWPAVQGSHHQPNQLHYLPQSQPLPFHQSLYSPAVAEPPAARYQCSQCPASFTLKSNADRHEKTIHFKKKLMQCAYCLKHFRDRTDLQRHLSSVHSKERGHTCPACAKAFSTQKNLATHIKVCCQVESVPGAILGGTTGMEMTQGGVINSLWQFSQELRDEFSVPMWKSEKGS